VNVDITTDCPKCRLRRTQTYSEASGQLEACPGCGLEYGVSPDFVKKAIDSAEEMQCEYLRVKVPQSAIVIKESETMTHGDFRAPNGHTPAPWAWVGNMKSQTFRICGDYGSRPIVIDFVRWGAQSAKPRFRAHIGSSSIMAPAEQFAQFQVGPNDVVGYEAAKDNPDVYRFDIRGIAHPDAWLMAAAPDLLEVWTNSSWGYGVTLILSALRDVAYKMDNSAMSSAKMNAALLRSLVKDAERAINLATTGKRVPKE